MTKELEIIDKVGIHIRPATIITKEASKYQSSIEFSYNGKKGNLKSIISLMSLGVPHKAKVVLTVSGSDEKKAMEAMCKILAKEKLAK